MNRTCSWFHRNSDSAGDVANSPYDMIYDSPLGIFSYFLDTISFFERHQTILFNKIGQHSDTDDSTEISICKL
jgi:hypothetical protein